VDLNLAQLGLGDEQVHNAKHDKDAAQPQLNAHRHRRHRAFSLDGHTGQRDMNTRSVSARTRRNVREHESATAKHVWLQDNTSNTHVT